MRATRKIIFSGLMVIFLANGLYIRVHAAEPENAITVSPAQVSITIGAADKEQVKPITIYNGFSTPISLELSLSNVDQTTGILTPTGPLDSQLSDVVSLSQKLLTINPKESNTVDIIVKNKPELQPGGTYVALLARQVSESQNSVGLQAAVSTNIFIIKEDGAIRGIDLTNIQSPKFLFFHPSSIKVTFKNTGNVQVVPRGQVVVTSANSNEIYKKGIINEQSISLLPQKSLVFDTPLQTIKKSWLPAKQQLIVQYRYDGSEEIKTYKQTFIYVPLYIIFGLILVVACLVFVTVRQRKKRHTVKFMSNTTQKTAKKIIVQDKNDGEKITVNKGK